MAEKLIYTMGEVAEMFDVNQSLLRHWEKQFGNVLKPKRNKKGNRLFSPQDVEQLKLIYHLVKERGMTLEGARKALRQHRPERVVPRDVELMERLQRIRSLLAEVREELKTTPGEVYTARDAEAVEKPEKSEPAVPASASAPAPASAPTPAPAAAAEVLPDEAPAAPAAPETSAAPEAPAAAAAPESPASRPVRKPRKKKEEDNKELFAYYEQSLF